MKWFLLLWLVLTFTGPLYMLLSGQADLKADYRTANRDSAGLAPDAKTHKGAVIQAYAARAFNWRGLFATHCWIAVKPEGASQYTVYQIVGWMNYRGLPALTVTEDIPDRNWFNAKPHLLLDVRGDKAEALIPKVQQAINDYPYSGPYTLWPGPNSNTFPAFIARAVPELELALPSDAVGKDYLGATRFFAPAPSGTGWQVSLLGALGITAAKKEGVELNILGLTYGVQFSPPRLLLPGLGD